MGRVNKVDPPLVTGTRRAFGADDVNPTRTPSAWMKLPVPMRTNEHAFGVDELLYRIPVPSPVL